MACRTFLNFLIPKEKDLSKSIFKAIDMDNYRVEKQTVVKIQLPDSEAKIELFSTNAGVQPF